MNPKSGTTTSAQKNKIKLLVSKLPNAQLFFTEYAGHATEIAKKAIIEEVIEKVSKIKNKELLLDLVPFIESEKTISEFVGSFASVIKNKLKFI